MNARSAGQRGQEYAAALAGPIRVREQNLRTSTGSADEHVSAARSGRKPDSFYRSALASAVLHLHDRASLEFNPLAQLPGVKRLADLRYGDKIWRKGLCLRDLLTEAIGDVLAAADDEELRPVRLVLERACSGSTLTNVAAELGVRRESLSRGLWRKVTALVWERLKPRLLTLENDT